jgi:hypothetical protein
MSKDELDKRKKTAIQELENAKKHCDYIIDTSKKTKEDTLNNFLEIIKNYT